MQQLINFSKRYKVLVYFIFLQCIAIALTINNYTFHFSKFINSSNLISGKCYAVTGSLIDYLKLKHTNNELAEENRILKNKLAFLNSKTDNHEEVIIDSTEYHQSYSFINGFICKNEFAKNNNYLTLNLGSTSGVSKEMAVINRKGIIGIIDAVSKNYARVQSILNHNSKINARFKNNFYFGSLTWNGIDHNIVQLTDIPRQATYKKGDTIITGGKSTIFPEGIPIGTVLKTPKKLSASNTLEIKLFNDMANIGPIYVVNCYDKIEIETLNKEL